MADTNTAFVDSIPDVYNQYLGPMFFEPSAIDLAGRLPVRSGAILELACGTGVFTRELLKVLDSKARLTATDLNEPMINEARRRVTDTRVEFRQADATALPFDRGTFDVVVCQYGVMFFSNKAAAAEQVRHVLRPNGTFVFNVWASIPENPVAAVAQRVITECYPDNTPTFYRVPWGYFDRERIASDLRDGGFSDIQIATVDLPCRAASSKHAAIGMVQGSPMLLAIRDRGTLSAAEVTRHMTEALSAEFGDGPLETRMRALAVTAR